MDFCKTHTMKKISLSILFVLATVMISSTAGADLARDFQTPPVSAKPQTWWHWKGGNINKEGITADLEAMKHVGISTAHMFNIDGKLPSSVRFMSDEWLDLFRHAVREADRCGLQIGLNNGPGWSASGGPWIDAEHNMQILTTSRVYAEGGGAEQTLVLPQPWSNLGYYRDVAVIAFPSGPTMVEAKPLVTASSEIAGALLMDGRPDTQITLPGAPAGKERFIQLEFPAPVTVEGLWLTHFGSTPGSGAEIQVSDDGRNFRKITRFDYEYYRQFNSGQIQVAFAPTTGKFFRLKFDQAAGDPFRIGEVELALTPVIQGFMGKAGYCIPTQGFSYAWGASRASGPMIPSGQVIDLTKQMDSSGRLKWTVPPGKWTVLRVGQTASGVQSVPVPTGVIALECDKLSKPALKLHYDAYVGRLARLCGPLAGKVFSSVTLDSWEVGGQNWTAGLSAEFRRRRGYDLTPFLPLLLTGRVEDGVETSERFLEDYRRTLQELFLENYFSYFRELCHQDGLQLACENYHWLYCDTLEIGGNVDASMGEFWAVHRKQPDITTSMYWCAKHASSCSQVYGSPLVPAEAFTSTESYTESPKTLKAKGDLMFAGGINQFVFHTFSHIPWLDRAPGVVWNVGIHMDRGNTWWEEGAAWIKYLERCQALLQKGLVVGQVVVLMPEYVPVAMSAVQAREQWVKQELPQGIGYVFCSQNGLLQKARLENGTIRFPLGEGYRLVVLPDTKVSSPEVLAKIKELLAAGLAVYATQRPDRAVGLRDQAVRDQEIQRLAGEIWGEVDGKQVTSRRVGKGLLVQGVSLAEASQMAGIQPDFAFANADGTPVEAYPNAGHVLQVNVIHRRAEGCEIYFVANHTPQEQRLVCRFGVSGMTPERWNPVTGRTEKLAAWRDVEGATELPLNLKPAESAFIVFRPAKGADSIVSLKREDKELFPALTNRVGAVAVARDVVDNFTMAAWVKAGGAITLPVEAATGVGGNPGRYAVCPVPGHEVFGIKDAGAGFTVAANGITVMEHGAGRFVNVLVYPTAPGADWNHVAVVYRDRTPTLFVNGKQVKTGLRGPMAVHPGAGVASPRSFAPFDGVVAGLKCVAKPLSETEIKALMQDAPSQVSRLADWRLTTDAKGETRLKTDLTGKFTAMTASGKTWNVEAPVLPAPIVVSGAWKVDFQPGRGAPTTAQFARLISWSDHEDLGIRYFSGHATYHNQITVPPTLLSADRRLLLNLGGVEVIAEVKVNGKDCGILWHSPYEVDVTEMLQAGANELEIRVVNLWPNRIIGDLRNPTAKPFTYCQTQLYSATDVLLPSGLLGPVELRAVSDLPVSSTKK